MLSDARDSRSSIICIPGPGMDVDWFQTNNTQYGPWPIWNALTNYTFPQIPRARVQHAEEIAGSPATIGLATGTLLILALSSNSRQFQSKNIKHTLVLPSQRVLDQITKAFIAFVIIPLVSFLFLSLALYKHLVACFLQRQLLCGPDAVWALDADEPHSRSVINILALIKGDIRLNELQHLVNFNILPASKKLRQFRKYSLFGYFYWERNKFEVNTLVRQLPGAGEITEDELRNVLASVNNVPLPANHTAGWEVLLGPHVAATHLEPRRTAILFRVHHSLGDGPALCQVLLSALSDSPLQNIALPISITKKRSFRLMETLAEGTRSVTHMATLSPDAGPLHGPRLSGDKKLVWRSSCRLLEAAKGVRAATGAPFTAGLLAALATTLHEYAAERGGTNGKKLSVVIPARLPRGDMNNELDNDFSMVVVQVRTPTGPISALERVHAAEKALRDVCTPATLIVSSLALRLIAGLLPRPLASLALRSTQCTAVLSNMPGPTHRLSLAGRPLTELAFWVPHRGTTGVGATALSYAGQLTLGLTVDAAVLAEPEDAARLMDSWERNLLHLEHELRLTTSV
ncbi:hypothetical protein B566_EDAN013189 [Ephemera danica]|nr:hypothetical protein B566_EDAN013189 [Ephemera danica]